MLNKIIFTILGVGMAAIFYPHTAQDYGKIPAVAGISTISESDLNSAPEMALNLSAPELTALSALAFDLNSGAILYSKNLDQKLPIASLTKLITALTIIKHHSLNSEVYVAKEAAGVAGSTIGLVAGERITVDKLLHAMLISSSNDAAVALADFAGGSQEEFVELMNQETLNLSLSNTHFSNPAGWDFGENYSNTLDLVKIVKEFMKYPHLAQIVRTKQMTITSSDDKYSHELTTTNKLLLDNSEVIGIKTGFTSKAQGNLIILADHGGSQVVTIVLGSNNREEDTQKLLDWVFKVYQW